MVSETREASGSAQLFTFPFVAVTVLSFLMTACLQMTVSAMPLFVVELGMERSLAGSATTVCTLASLFFRPASARMSDRQGELKTSLIAAGLLVVVFGCYFGCTRIWQIMVLRAAQGIGISMLSTSLGALATAIIPKQSITKGMSYYSLGNAVALSVGPAIGLALVGSGVYWHLFATGVAFACIMIALLLMIRKPVGEGLQSKSVAKVGEPAQGFVRGMLECGGLPACGILMLLILSQTSLSTFLSFYAGTRGIESASTKLRLTCTFRHGNGEEVQFSIQDFLVCVHIPLEVMTAGLVELLVQRLAVLNSLQIIIKEMRCAEQQRTEQ